LLKAADELPPNPNSPLHSRVYRLAIVLLYTTGLRRGEMVRLLIGDYEPSEHILLIRESKFHRSRLVPLSADAVQEIDTYLKGRALKGFPVSPKSPLLGNGQRGQRAYAGSTISVGMRPLFRTARIRTNAGWVPRTHDIRHSFAVHALLRWYRTGEDVQAKLPFLSTYMGHVSVVSTQHYLHFVERTAVQASDRFEARYGVLVSASPHDQGDASR